MSAARKPQSISVDDYLTGELQSQVKHEYLGGFVYAMAGASYAHNRIAGNVFAQLHARLRGQPCEAFNSDVKIRVNLPTHVRFYYPDASVVCDPNAPGGSFHDRPVVLVEVLSHKTRRVAWTEKKDAYLSLSTLRVYLIIEQDSPLVNVYRRTDQGFVLVSLVGLEMTIPLPEINVELPLAENFERVEFIPEPENEE